MKNKTNVTNAQALVVAYDDGAGDVKVGYALNEQHLFFKMRSLVTPQNHTTMGFGGDDMNIEIPTTQSGYDGIIYSVGNRLAYTTMTRPDVSESRYTAEPFARVRFYAAMTRVLEETNAGPLAQIDLRVGVSTGLYEKLKKAVKTFFSGEHFWKNNGKEYSINVVNVTVGPQAYYAANVVIKNPPAKFAPFFEKHGFNKTTAVVVDLGYYSVDVARYERLTLTDVFSQAQGVNDVIQALEVQLRQLTRVPPSDEALTEAITPGDMYGLIRDFSVPGGAVNCLLAVEKSKETVWAAIWSTIQRKINHSVMGSYFIFTGGGSIILANEISRTVIDPKTGGTFQDYMAFVNLESEWSVVQGMLL